MTLDLSSRTAPRGAIRALPAAMALLSCATALHAAKADFKVAPGPTTMSEEEKALAPDPNRGMEHAVILLEEVDRDESLGTDTMISFHRRAKILSNEGRRLADVEIPFNTKTGTLQQWWGRVLLPDGSSRVLKQEELKPQMVVRTNSQEERIFKGALPGVQPGCVIDYGYTFWARGVEGWTPIALQRAYPLRLFRYRWTPDPRAARTFHPTRTEELQVDINKVDTIYIVTAKDLPPVPEEAYMPADSAVRAMINLYYLDEKTNVDDYWNVEAKRLDREARRFASDKAVQSAIASMSISAGADLPAKLRTAYDWLAANIRNTVLMTSEEEEKIPDMKKADEEREKRSGEEALAAREMLPYQMDYLMLGIARKLGAEANIVLATDRTELYWDPGLLTMDQFDWTLVSMRSPGDPDDKAIIVDTGSGLPFGEIPWVLTGVRGFLAKADGYREIPLWPSDIGKNVSETKASLSFDAEAVKVKWSRTGTGQQGYFTRRELRKLPPEDRTKKLDRLCGAAGDFEVSKAEAPKVLSDPSAPFQIDCEGEMTGMAPGEADEFSLKIDGAWFEPVPELTASTRTHPVVFSYPRIDRTTLEIASPPGFAPKGAPAPAEAEAKFGRYTLEVKATATGYTVKREFWFGPLIVKPEEYGTLRSFIQDVRRADAARLDFKRTGS